MAMKAACHRVSRTVMHMRMSVTLSADEQRQLPGKGNRGLPPPSFQRDLRATADLVTWGRIQGPAGLRW